MAESQSAWIKEWKEKNIFLLHVMVQEIWAQTDLAPGWSFH